MSHKAGVFARREGHSSPGYRPGAFWPQFRNTTTRRAWSGSRAGAASCGDLISGADEQLVDGDVLRLFEGIEHGGIPIVMRVLTNGALDDVSWRVQAVRTIEPRQIATFMRLFTSYHTVSPAGPGSIRRSI